MRARLTPEQREQIAAAAATRYAAGETWQQIGDSHGVTGEHVRRLTVARVEVTYRRWGQQPVADLQEARRRRDEGQSIPAIADALGCSLQAVRTALERTGRNDTTRYPRLSTRRRPTAAELEHITQLYEACPQAPRAREGARNVRGDEGRALAEACRALVDDGVPMLTLARDLGRGATWIHFILECHDLRPAPHAIKSTARRTRV